MQLGGRGQTWLRSGFFCRNGAMSLHPMRLHRPKPTSKICLHRPFTSTLTANLHRRPTYIGKCVYYVPTFTIYTYMDHQPTSNSCLKKAYCQFSCWLQFSLKELKIGRLDGFFSTPLPKISPNKHHFYVLLLKVDIFSVLSRFSTKSLWYSQLIYI